MNIQHFEKGFHYNDRELLEIARKIGKLATYCKHVKDEDSFIRIEAEYRSAEKQRDAMKSTVTVTLPKTTLRAESRRADVLEAIDRCVEKLYPQLERYKEMHTGKGRARAARRRGE